MDIKNKKEIDIMRHGGKILGSVLKDAQKLCKPGIKTIEIECFIEKKIRNSGGEPSFKNFKGYPYSSCISINEEVVHTLPSQRMIQDGDIVSIDVGVFYKGFHNDAAVTVGAGKISRIAKKLLSVTNKSLNEAIKLVKPHKKIGDIQATIQCVVEKEGFQLVRDLSGHGIGRKLQEPPSIPNIGKINTGFTLQEGMTFCLEPMVSIGSYKVCTMPDGWSVATCDKSLTAHFEHTILITANGSEVLTQP